MTTINTYLTFKGNCEEAFNFYKSAFGGEFSHLSRFKDMPTDGKKSQLTASELNLIMHISYPIGNTIIMGSDSTYEWAEKVTIGNNFSISINTDSEDEANRLFSILSENGHVTMPMSTTFWNSYFGMFTDKFDINWMISYDSNQKSS